MRCPFTRELPPSWRRHTFAVMRAEHNRRWVRGLVEWFRWVFRRAV
jgi:hypothetical protein